MIGLALQPARIKASVVAQAASLFFMDRLAALAAFFFMDRLAVCPTRIRWSHPAGATYSDFNAAWYICNISGCEAGRGLNEAVHCFVAESASFPKSNCVSSAFAFDWLGH